MSNEDWLKAYKKVRERVAKLYSKEEGVRIDRKQGETKSELETYKKMLIAAKDRHAIGQGIADSEHDEGAW